MFVINKYQPFNTPILNTDTIAFPKQLKFIRCKYIPALKIDPTSTAVAFVGVPKGNLYFKEKSANSYRGAFGDAKNCIPTIAYIYIRMNNNIILFIIGDVKSNIIPDNLPISIRVLIFDIFPAVGFSWFSSLSICPSLASRARRRIRNVPVT